MPIPRHLINGFTIDYERTPDDTFCTIPNDDDHYYISLDCRYSDKSSGMLEQWPVNLNLHDVATKISDEIWMFTLPGNKFILLSSNGCERSAIIDDINLFDVNDVSNFTNFVFDSIHIDMFDNGQGSIDFIKSDTIVENCQRPVVVGNIQLHPNGPDDKAKGFVSVTYNGSNIWTNPEA